MTIARSLSRSVRRRRLRRAPFLASAILLAACAEYLGTSFSEIVPPEMAGRDVQPGAKCALDSVNGAAAGAPWRVSRQYRVYLHGWAIDGASRTASDWVVVRLSSSGRSYYAVTWARGTRDDLTAELGTGGGAARAGFDLVGTLQQVPPGSYDIDLITAAPSGLVSCTTGRQLVAV